MNPPEIEYLVTEAIDKRPKVTNAPMNLYIYDKKLICGARIVMPIDADFVAHITPDQLQNGFSTEDWKLIVEKIKEIVGTGDLATNAIREPVGVSQNELPNQAKADQEDFEERRKEQRLQYHRPIWFAREFNETPSQGRMVDVSSGGMAFTCRADENCLLPGQRITTRFSLPRLNRDNSFDTVSFNRIGCICRVNKADRFMRQVAIQFAKPLPFKPVEQHTGKFNAQQKPDLFTSPKAAASLK